MCQLRTTSTQSSSYPTNTAQHGFLSLPRQKPVGTCTIPRYPAGCHQLKLRVQNAVIHRIIFTDGILKCGVLWLPSTGCSCWFEPSRDPTPLVRPEGITRCTHRAPGYEDQGANRPPGRETLGKFLTWGLHVLLSTGSRRALSYKLWLRPVQCDEDAEANTRLKPENVETVCLIILSGPNGLVLKRRLPAYRKGALPRLVFSDNFRTLLRTHMLSCPLVQPMISPRDCAIPQRP